MILLWYTVPHTLCSCFKPYHAECVVPENINTENSERRAGVQKDAICDDVRSGFFRRLFTEGFR